ncbi:MAG: histidine--tRNA ligase [Clostridia bacterium]|nr:histidine--tRNA ligase [Clostridia bacterium]
MNISKQKGTKDIYSDDILIWQFIEENIRKIAKKFNVGEIRTPVFEATELYMRGVGDETDIVSKEMYTFLDKGDRSITLRPELTAGVVRSYIENGMNSLPQPLKLWYIGNMYRYEKMQKGRYREFAQFGTEIFGSASYLADAETILVSSTLLKEIGLSDDIVLSINSIGCSECRKKYIGILREYLKPRIDNMCDSCKVRYNKNILRIIDCKEEKCNHELKDAPYITDNLCDDCKEDFSNLQNVLTNLKVEYVIDKKIVRGLDYYNKTVYEYISKDLGIAVGGGGRYDGLVSTLGGPNTPAVGFALGMDRLVLLLKEKNILEKIKNNVDIYFALFGDTAHLIGNNLMQTLRNEKNIYVIDGDISNKSPKAQLKYASSKNAKFVCIIGQDEIDKNICIIKNMETGIQENINLNSENIIKYIDNN